MESTHLIKGTSLINLRKYLNDNIHDGFFEENAKEMSLLGGNLILASSWYDAKKTMDLSKRGATRMGKDLRDFTITFSMYLITQDLNGVFKFLMRLGGIVRILASTPRISTAYNNFLTYDIVQNEPGSFRVRVGAPPHLLDWELDAIEGAMHGLLEVFASKVDKKELSHREMTKRNNEPFELITMSFFYSSLENQ